MRDVTQETKDTPRRTPRAAAAWLQTHPGTWQPATGWFYPSRYAAKLYAAKLRGKDPRIHTAVRRTGDGHTVWACHGIPTPGADNTPPEEAKSLTSMSVKAQQTVHGYMSRHQCGYYEALNRIVEAYDDGKENL